MALNLIVRAGERVCGLPIACALETMRPRPIDRVSNSPDFVLGLSIVRGDPILVIDLGRLLGDDNAAEVSRFVTVRAGVRTLALAVRAVVGVREIDWGSLSQLPPLLNADGDARIEAIGRLDAELLVVLQTLRLLPDDVWDALLPGAEPS